MSGASVIRKMKKNYFSVDELPEDKYDRSSTKALAADHEWIKDNSLGKVLAWSGKIWFQQEADLAQFVLTRRS